MATEDTTERIHRLKPSDLADWVLAAVRDLGGEAQRADIIDRALDLGGWSDEERAVRSWYAGAARTYHLRTCADYAVDHLRRRDALVEGAAVGRWRLPDADGARAGAIEPHPFGRVFTVGVGLADDPVEDDWAAEEQAHLWFGQRSTKLSRGDHVFALGAGRRSAVLGLFEVTSAGTSRSPRNPWDPDRWRFVVAVRPLAGVPPAEAVSVDGLTAPRGAPHEIAAPEQRTALYAAVAGHGIAGGARPPDDHADRPPFERGVAARRARPFDPARVPQAAEAHGGGAEPEATLALQEKAQQGHHEILVALHRELVDRGWIELEEMRSAFDLRGQRADGLRAIFEAKTIGAGNAVQQCRSGLAQLLEYRLDHGQPEDALCLVIDGEVPEARVELLQRLGVAVVQTADARVRGLNAAADALLAP